MLKTDRTNKVIRLHGLHAAALAAAAALPVSAQTPSASAPSSISAAAPTPPTAQPPILYATPADVSALLEQAKKERQGDAANAPFKQIVRVPGYRAQLEFRTGTTPPQIHNTSNELTYVMEGSGTIVMGGTLDHARIVGSNQAGDGITGGQAYPLTKGAFVMVPAGTPHGVGTTDPKGLQTFTVFMPAAAPIPAN